MLPAIGHNAVPVVRALGLLAVGLPLPVGAAPATPAVASAPPLLVVLTTLAVGAGVAAWLHRRLVYLYYAWLVGTLCVLSGLLLGAAQLPERLIAILLGLGTTSLLAAMLLLAASALPPRRQRRCWCLLAALPALTTLALLPGALELSLLGLGALGAAYSGACLAWTRAAARRGHNGWLTAGWLGLLSGCLGLAASPDAAVWGPWLWTAGAVALALGLAVQAERRVQRRLAVQGRALGLIARAGRGARAAHARQELMVARLQRRLAEQQGLLVAARRDFIRAEAALLEQSMRDQATGLVSHASFDERYHQEWRRAFRYRYPLTLMLIEIDGWSDLMVGGQIDSGQVLARIGQVLDDIVRRPTDLLARIGDARFAVLMADTPLEGVERLMRQIQSRLAEIKLGEAAATATIGAASVEPRRVRHEAVLMSYADEALHRAGELGSGRGWAFQPPQRLRAETQSDTTARSKAAASAASSG